jgi:class 3 adenylate cyclase
MQTNQTNDIWTILVPEFVRNFFSDNGEDAGQYKEKSVAILFCYVCNFDSIIEEEGRNVVRLLDNLYREFDKLCSSFAVQKIETVGYTYMAATGIRKIETQMENEMVKRNKVERLLGMAQQMLEKTKMFKWGAKKNKDLDIKIGIHVGEVVVGVIGRHKKQFSLIGTNVNATSRHGSTGKLGSITLSR